MPIFEADDGSCVLNDLLLFLHKSSTQNLILRNVGSYDNDTLSLKPYFFHALKKLVIVEFHVLFPPEFKFLTNLRTLILIRVSITDHQLEVLVSHCPKLEELVLCDVIDLCDFKIRALNLLLLDIGLNDSVRFSFIDAPHLKRLAISISCNLLKDFDDSLREEEDDRRNKDEAAKLFKLLKNSCNLESFSITCVAGFFEYTSVERMPYWSSGCQLIHMKELFMTLCFDDVKMLSILLFFLKSCPNLQQLAFKGRGFTTGPFTEIDYWKKQRPTKCLINHLMSVQIENICLMSINWVEFVEFILINARVVVRMRINFIA